MVIKNTALGHLKIQRLVITGAVLVNEASGGARNLFKRLLRRPRVPRRLESTKQSRLRQGFARSSPLGALDTAISVW